MITSGILDRPSLDELTDAGHIRPESRVDLVRPVIGMAVHGNAADILLIQLPATPTPAWARTMLRADCRGWRTRARRGSCRTGR